jgi:hypothetical protein
MTLNLSDKDTNVPQSPTTPTSPSTASIRSGDLVNQSVTTTGLLGALLSPWIKGVLQVIADHSYGYLVFGEGYETQLTMAIVVMAMAVHGMIRMRSIRKTDGEPPVVESNGPEAVDTTKLEARLRELEAAAAIRPATDLR